MRPLVRLALGMGLKHPHMEELLRELLLSEATRLWQAKGVSHPNISQLSITTGLNRKQVTARVRDPVDPLPHTELSAAAKTLTLWLQMAGQDAGFKRLPLLSTGTGLAFEDVARRASRGDVHHRSVLDELARLGMCTKEDGHVELTAEGFVPTGDMEGILAFLGDNLRDHAAAAVSNTLGEAPLFLERAVFADGLTQEDCDLLHSLTRQRWATLHRELVGEMTKAVEKTDGKGAKRMRVGVYLYHSDVKDLSK
jgi:hypothetical protein